MRTIAIILILSLSLVGCSGTKSAEKLAKEEQQYTALKQLVADRTYELEATWAYPFSAQQVNLFGNTNFLRFEKDTISSYLPYFGVRRNGPVYGNESGVVVNGPYTEYKIEEHPKKRKIEISLEIREKSETYNMNLTLYADRKADITIKSSQRDVIRYGAKIVASTKPDQTK